MASETKVEADIFPPVLAKQKDFCDVVEEGLLPAVLTSSLTPSTFQVLTTPHVASERCKELLESLPPPTEEEILKAAKSKREAESLALWQKGTPDGIKDLVFMDAVICTAGEFAALMAEDIAEKQGRKIKVKFVKVEASPEEFALTLRIEGAVLEQN